MLFDRFVDLVGLFISTVAYVNVEVNIRSIIFCDVFGWMPSAQQGLSTCTSAACAICSSETLQRRRSLSLAVPPKGGSGQTNITLKLLLIHSNLQFFQIPLFGPPRLGGGDSRLLSLRFAAPSALPGDSGDMPLDDRISREVRISGKAACYPR